VSINPNLEYISDESLEENSEPLYQGELIDKTTDYGHIDNQAQLMAESKPQRTQSHTRANTAARTEFEVYMARENIYPSITNIEISDSLEEFHNIRKHFLIFTDAGKPIYSRYGDETVLAPFFATMSAIMPKIQSYFWDPSQHAKQNKNKLHVLRSKGQIICFLKKGSLIYMCLYNTSKMPRYGL
jgi:hypothetical protein